VVEEAVVGAVVEEVQLGLVGRHRVVVVVVVVRCVVVEGVEPQFAAAGA
jgi:hypothetical protein